MIELQQQLTMADWVNWANQYSSAILIAALCNSYGFPVSTISVHELHVTRCQLQA